MNFLIFTQKKSTRKKNRKDHRKSSQKTKNRNFDKFLENFFKFWQIFRKFLQITFGAISLVRFSNNWLNFSVSTVGGRIRLQIVPPLLSIIGFAGGGFASFQKSRIVFMSWNIQEINKSFLCPEILNNFFLIVFTS